MHVMRWRKLKPTLSAGCAMTACSPARCSRLVHIHVLCLCTMNAKLRTYKPILTPKSIQAVCTYQKMALAIKECHDCIKLNVSILINKQICKHCASQAHKASGQKAPTLWLSISRRHL